MRNAVYKNVKCPKYSTNWPPGVQVHTPSYVHNSFFHYVFSIISLFIQIHNECGIVKSGNTMNQIKPSFDY